MRILIADSFHPSIFDMLEKESWEYVYEPDINRAGIKAILNEFEILLVRSKTRVDLDLISNAPLIKLVGRAGSGLDNIDVEQLEKSGVKVVNAAEGNSDAVGDHTLGLILALTRRIPFANNQVKFDRVWDREGNRGVELNALTVGLIGYGNTGCAVARRLSSFGCRVIAYDKYKESFSDDFVEEVGLNEMYKSVDLLSLHIPLTNETEKLVDIGFINAFSKNIFLVNTSRGEIVDTKALMTELNSGKILGAALDVLENEKINNLTIEQSNTFDFLQKSPKVILTPHIAGWTFQSYRKINEVLISKIKSSSLSFK